MSAGFSRTAGDMGGELEQTSGEGARQRALLPTQAATEAAPPYPPSWVDKLTDWVRRMPVPAPAFYLALGLGLSLAHLALVLLSVDWASGTLALGTVVLYSFLNGMTPAYLLGLVHYLDNSAAAAMSRFRPVLEADDSGYTRLCYQLTTLPPRPTTLAAGLGVIYTFVALLVNVFATGDQGAGAVSPFLIALSVGFSLLIYVLVAVLVYHTLHQLRMVNKIYTEHTRINLFQLGPLYALSGLTARTAIGIAIPTYLWFQINSLFSPRASASDIFQTVVLGSVTVLTFVVPLLGAHNLLAREKQRLQDGAARRVEVTLAALHARVDAGELGDLGEHKEALNVLMTEQGLLDRLRTWPWRTETVRGLGLTFLLPILIWVVQRALERLGF